jgi:hypothetical protein
MAEQNSIQTILPEFLRMFNNSIESFEKVNQAITSSRDSVTVNIQNNDNTISRVTIPSFGYLKNSVDRLDSNIQTITNVGGGDSSIRLADGTFRKLVLAQLPVEAPDLTGLNTINTFDTKSNWFFEGLINPLLYVTFDLTGQVPIDTERAIVSRYILDCNTQSKINYFNNNFNTKSDIVYDEYLLDLVNNNIAYVLDEAVVDLPPRNLQYSGTFSVLRIADEEVTQEINGVSITTTKKLYKLNKTTYSDVEAAFPDGIGLKVGDSLEVISDPIDTRYQIIQIDASTSSVILNLIEGSQPVTIGADVLKIASSANNTVELEVSIGFGERCVTFIKPIDPNSKIPSVNWSPGSGFYTSELTTIDNAGTKETLATFYQQQAVDFGRFLLSFAQDKMPTTKQGIKPNAPILEANDFRVVLINGQVTNADAVVQLQQLNDQKNTLEAEIKQLDTAIVQKRTKIQTTNYATEVERDADKNELQGLVTERSSTSELYSSVVKEIAAKADDNSVESILPKYRARGFWKVPAPKVSPETGEQDIIKFVIRYRYLSADGAANPVDEFTFQDGVGTSQGAFSNWVQVETAIRPREKDSVTGLYYWEPVNDDNAEAVNMNQLDIPVRKGEIVEVQVKSVSEAGWPSNPLMSNWSLATRIEFPANLSSDSAVETILQENQQDLAKISLEEDLNEMGIQEHLSSSFVANEKYFAHTAPTIASGFLSENQTPIDLFSKLVDMSNQLLEFEEILKRAAGLLEVTLVDDQGNSLPLQKNTLTKFFAGFYLNEVADLDDPRGAIVSKTYYINLANAEQTVLQLISRVTGNRTRMTKQSENPAPGPSTFLNNTGAVILPATYPWLDDSAINQSDGIATYTADDSDYNTLRKYDLTPILLANPSVTAADKFGQDVSIAPYQSAQNKGQYIFCRLKDVASEEVFYNYVNPDGDFVINLDNAENYYGRGIATGIATGGEFIWGGGFVDINTPDTATQVGWNSDTLEVHIEHPYVKNMLAFAKAYETLTTVEGAPLGDIQTITDITALGPPFDFTASHPIAAASSPDQVLFRQSKFAPLKSDETKGKTQNIYLNENVAQFPPAGVSPYPASLITPGGGPQNFEASPTLNVANLQSIAGGDSYSRNIKNSFSPLDQYLLGQKSCGAYLFIAPEDHTLIQVTGDSSLSTKDIVFGNTQSLNIPLTFQYRMTDYFGSGSGSSGGGRGSIAGDNTGATVNVTYAKRIGFDLYTSINEVFQFDVEIFATYKSDRLNIETFPAATISKSLSNLEKIVSSLAPSVTETKVNQDALTDRRST